MGDRKQPRPRPEGQQKPPSPPPPPAPAVPMVIVDVQGMPEVEARLRAAMAALLRERALDEGSAVRAVLLEIAMLFELGEG